LAGVLVVFRAFSEEHAEQKAAKPPRSSGIPGASREQSVAGTNSLAVAEPNPRLEFGNKRWVAHLGRVAFNHILKNALHQLLVVNKNDSNAMSHPGLFQQSKVFTGDGLAVVFRTRRLPLWNSLKKGRSSRFGLLQEKLYFTFSIMPVACCGEKTCRQSGMSHIFSGAAERNKQVVVVRVHDGTPSRKVRKDGYCSVAQLEFPALRIMARWGQDRGMDQVA
jgi:hypothetical protein